MFSRLKLRSFKSWIALFLFGIGLSAVVAACSPASDTASTASPNGAATGQKPDVELTLVGYAAPKAAHDAIIPLFTEKWKQEQGQNVTFKQTYGGSGTQTRAVIDGLEADVVHLAIGADVLKLVKAGLIKDDWDKRVPNNGIAGQSVAAVITRSGNPKNIKTFEDLTRSDVKWVTANPKTSGGARWNFLALWDYSHKTGGDDTKALDFVTRAFSNVVVLAKDAREATDAFAKQGQGDALLNYENEVILAKQKGEALDYVIPDVNVSIETPAAAVDQNVDKHGTREVAEAFVQFLFTPEAQREFAKVGYRPIGDIAKESAFVQQYPPVKQLGKISEYGGWKEFQDKFFADGAVFDQIEQKVSQ